MIAASPHRYRAEARALGRPEAVIDAAVSQAAILETRGAPAILTLGHLAFRMGVSHSYLRSVIAKRGSDCYREFKISKRGGGMRRIVVPEPKLMAIQRWIVREILRREPSHPSSHAYARGCSIVTCANKHLGSGWLLKLDIHDFFESIPEKSVYRVFRLMGYQPLVAFELARLCTRPWLSSPNATSTYRRVRNWKTRGIEFYRREFTGYIPQGAPTSPMLSNLVCRPLDDKLAAFAAREGLVYTRYSDDLTFSGPSAGFKRDRALHLIAEVRTILARFHFRMHEHKVSIIPPGGRKIVLGLLVDRDRPRLSRELRSRLVDHVRGIEKFGLASHAAERKFASVTGMVNHVAGLLRFASEVEPDVANPLIDRLKAALLAFGWTPAYE